MPTHPLPTRPQVLETARRALNRDELVRTETLATEDAAGRICASPMRALCPSPTAHVSTRDGLAVASALTRSGSPDSPAELEPGTDCHPVNTGWALPPGMDAVIPRENVRQEGNGPLLVSERVRPGQHVRPQGEDLEPGDLVLGPDTLISAVDVGSLLTAGIFELPVHQRVRMAFISTGDEVLGFRSRPVPEPGQVIESNARVFCSLARTWGAEAESLAPVADDPEALAEAVRQALEQEYHVVAVGAGSSSSNRDYTRTVFGAAGEILTPGVAMVPGRPGILATAQGKLLAGVPGNPAGALAFMQEILGPLACWLGRRPLPPRSQAKAVMACDLAPRPGMERLVRIGLGLVDGALLAAPLDRRSGLVRTLARATGLLRVPADCPGLKAGDVVRVEWLTPHADPENHLIILGERCRALDILADELLEHGPGPRLDFVRTSAPEALESLARNRALAATCILPESRPARSALLREHLPDATVRAVPLAEGLSLVVPESRLEDPRLAALLGLLDDPAVLRRLA